MAVTPVGIRRTAPQAPVGNSAAPTNVVNPNIDNVNYNRIATQANDISDPEMAEMAKYYAAVDLARQKFSGDEKANEKMFRQEIDRIYKDKLQGTLNPDTDIRGNNAFSLAIRGLNEGYDDLLTAAGGLVDNSWDTVAGGIADATGQHKAAEKLRTLMDDRDVGTAIDIGADIGLSVLPFGMPAVVAKNLIQQSDNFDEALKGRDNVTLEKLTDTQRGARLGEGLLTTALAAVPGAGRAGKLIKGTSNDAAKEVVKNADEAVKAAQKQIGKSDKSINNLTKKLDATKDPQKDLEDLLAERKVLSDAYRNVDEMQRAANAAKNGQHPQPYLADQELKQAQRELDSALQSSQFNNLQEADAAIRKASENRNALGSRRALQKALDKANESKGEAETLFKDSKSELERAKNFAGKTRLGRMIEQELLGWQAMRDAVKAIPKDYNASKQIVDETTKALKLEGIDKLPRTNRGVAKLIKEHPEKFGIKAPEKKVPKGADAEKWLVDNLDKVVAPRRQQQMAAMYANQIRDNIGRTNLQGTLRRAMDNIGAASRPESFSPKLFDETQEQMLKQLAENKKVRNTAKGKVADTLKAGGNSLVGLGTLGVQGALGGMATGDYDNFQQGIDATFRDILNNRWKFMAGLYPIGAKRASMRINPGIRGKTGSAVPFNAARGAGLGNYITSQTEPDTSKATSEEEILRRLAALKAGE